MREIKVCAVCGVVLEQLGPADEWVHWKEVLGFGDHIAVPVDYYDIPVNVLCDFCNVTIPAGKIMTIPCEAFEMPSSQSVSMGNWAGCEDCADLVRRRRWTQLMNRCIEVVDQETARLGEPSVPRAFQRAHLKEQFNLLEVHMTGPPRPWRTGDERDMEARP